MRKAFFSRRCPRFSFLAAHAASLFAAIALGSTCLPALCADEGSLDSMWMDPATPNASQSATQPAADVKTETPTETAVSAPLVLLQDFRESSLVTKGGWPGVGPFKQETDDPTNMADEKGNRLRVDLNGTHVTRAQLDLVDRRPGALSKDLLDMQMNIDFLLEAVGVKPRNIADLNVELDKNREVLFRADNFNPLNLTAGRLMVSIEKRKSSSGNIDYVVAVNSLDAHRTVIKEHSLTEEPVKKSVVSTAPPPSVVTPPPPRQSSPPIRMSTAPAAVPSGPSDTVREELSTVIKNWQRIKKSVLKSRQTAELQTALGGRALALQLNAVKWLKDNHKYYDMNPKGIAVDKVTELTPNRKYVVLAEVKEGTKYIDEATHSVLKDTDDSYKVKYTIERIGNQWLIVDSLLPNTQAENHSSSKKTH